MRTKTGETMTIDPDGFYKEYKRIAGDYGGVEELCKMVAPAYHEHYLSGAKRQGRVSKSTFYALVKLGADREKMLGTKKKVSVGDIGQCAVECLVEYIMANDSELTRMIAKRVKDLYLGDKA